MSRALVDHTSAAPALLLLLSRNARDNAHTPVYPYCRLHIVSWHVTSQDMCEACGANIDHSTPHPLLQAATLFL